MPNSVHWTYGDQGVLYQAADGTHQQVRYRHLGTVQGNDTLIVSLDSTAERAQTEATVTEDGRFIVLSRTLPDGKANVWVAFIHGVDLIAGNTPLKWIAVASDTYAYELRYVTNDSNRFYWITNRNAPLKKIVYTDLDLISAHRPRSMSDPDMPSTNLRLNSLISEQ